MSNLVRTLHKSPNAKPILPLSIQTLSLFRASLDSKLLSIQSRPRFVTALFKTAIDSKPLPIQSRSRFISALFKTAWTCNALEIGRRMVAALQRAAWNPIPEGALGEVCPRTCKHTETGRKFTVNTCCKQKDTENRFSRDSSLSMGHENKLTSESAFLH